MDDDAIINYGETDIKHIRCGMYSLMIINLAGKISNKLKSTVASANPVTVRSDHDY